MNLSKPEPGTFEYLVFMTGVADFIRFKTRCPRYWRKQPEELLWKRGAMYAKANCL